ncbi:DUF2326 domain-containing protein [Rurimicrobium arvi]|uniref:DUF2326 domain-containing protein n=1 Tax=Rurimicrobium arvi TaxID=2049916 RepID=A0ABP8N109_9BACT
MFLKNLTIECDGHIIRNIPFKKGLNLIVDTTVSSENKESGNNVGKTTVLRLVDFCFNGDGKNIYSDTEFKEKRNTTVEQFLTQNNVIVTITLKQDLDDEHSEEVVIRRNFLKRSEKIFEVNGESYKVPEYDKVLKELIFNTDVDKPTFRQIIARNIRDEKNKLVNTIQVLHPTTTFEEYEALFFFWFGIETDVAGKKQKLQEQRKAEEKFLTRLKKQLSESEIQQALAVINRDIQTLTRLKDDYIIDDDYQDDLNAINAIKSTISSIASAIDKLALRKEIIEDSKRELEKGHVSIDNDRLREIYATAEVYLPEMHKRFEDLVAFHNRMQNQKIAFVTEELPAVDAALKIENTNLNKAIKEERRLSEKLRKSTANDEYNRIVKELTRMHEQKGHYENQALQISQAREKIARLKSEIEGINNGLSSKDDDFKAQVEEFNKYFTTLSEALYDEKFFLYAEKNDRAYQLKISSIDGNLGTGKKKGQIAAFDLAYIQYCDANDIPCLHFLMQDQTENIHDNQITTLAALTETMHVQYIIPILRDKVPDSINISDYAVLVLSQDDKLFKI